jgi:hypothetical protein
LKDADTSDERRRKQRKEIAENKVCKEKQFNRQVEVDEELKKTVEGASYTL